MRRALAVAAFLLASIASAYVLPTYSILRRMAERREDLGVVTLRVEGTLSFHGRSAAEAGAALNVPADRGEVQVDGIFWAKPPGRCRFEGMSAEGGRAAAVLSGGKQRSEGQEISSLSPALEAACALLALTSDGQQGAGRASVERFLQRMSVEYKRSSLGRFGGQIAYVIGDPAEAAPQLWVYKDAFTPARLRFVDGQKTAWDVRLLDYGSSSTGDLFPRALEVWRDGQLELRFTALSGDGRAQAPEKLF